MLPKRLDTLRSIGYVALAFELLNDRDSFLAFVDIEQMDVAASFVDLQCASDPSIAFGTSLKQVSPVRRTLASAIGSSAECNRLSIHGTQRSLTGQLVFGANCAQRCRSTLRKGHRPTQRCDLLDTGSGYRPLARSREYCLRTTVVAQRLREGLDGAADAHGKTGSLRMRPI